jgi:hypothetical protein
MSRMPVVLIVLLGLALGACGLQSSTATVPVPSGTSEQSSSQPASSPRPEASATSSAPTVDQVPTEPVTVQPAPSSTPTPTSSLLLGTNTQTPEPAKPTGGTIEVRTPNTINETTECVNFIPFRLESDDARTMCRGEGRIECVFEGKPIGGEGSPVVYHVILEYDTVVNGELLPATPDRPEGWLDAYLTVDGTITQYYTDYPPQATNPCPESSPCRTPTSDVIPLPFAFEEGSTISVPWAFILHLE